MDRQARRRLPRLARWAWHLSLVGLPILGAGCTDASPVAAWFLRPTPTAVVQAAAAKPTQPAIVQVGYQAPAEKLPLPKEAPVNVAPTGIPHVEAKEPKVVPISLDIILHLAEEQNFKLGQYRAKVDEAEARADIACKCPPVCCPPPGQPGQSKCASHAYLCFAAEREVWQDRLDLSKLDYDTLYDATSTYIDLLTALSGKSVASALQKDLTDLLDRANERAKTEPAAKVEVSRILAELEALRANVYKFEAEITAAGAKLCYLLGLDPCTHLVTAESGLVPFALIDADQPLCDFIAQVLGQGPGIREMEGLMNLVEDALARQESSCLSKLLGCRTRCQRDRMADAQRAQVHLAYDDLRAKLAAAVNEARDDIIKGRDEILHSREQTRHASEARDQSQKRLINTDMGSSPSEVLLSLQAMSFSEINHLTALRDYNKAQLRLLLLTSGGHCGHPPAPAAGVPVIAPKDEKEKPKAD